MAYKQGRKAQGRGDSDFIALTGLWQPESGKQHLGQGTVKLGQLQELMDAIEDKGGDACHFYLFKNKFNDGDNDPRYKLTALPLDPQKRKSRDDDDEEPRRRKRAQRDDDDIEEEDDRTPSRAKKRRPRDEDEEEEEERPKKKRRSPPPEDEDDDDIPF